MRLEGRVWENVAVRELRKEELGFRDLGKRGKGVGRGHGAREVGVKITVPVFGAFLCHRPNWALVNCLI